MDQQTPTLPPHPGQEGTGQRQQGQGGYRTQEGCLLGFLLDAGDGKPSFRLADR